MADTMAPMEPPKAPNECCTKAENLTDAQDYGKGTAEDPSGKRIEIEKGYRQCKVCGRKHYFMRRLTPAAIGITPVDTL